jgi:hypothetical protein
MMLSDIDSFYLNQQEPAKGCFMFLRSFILNYDEQITEAWKYRMPFFLYKGKMFCYVWTHKKTGRPFIGFVDGKWLNHPQLTHEDRARIKIIQIDPEQDIPVDTIGGILNMAIRLYSD